MITKKKMRNQGLKIRIKVRILEKSLIRRSRNQKKEEKEKRLKNLKAIMERKQSMMIQELITMMHPEIPSQRSKVITELEMTEVLGEVEEAEEEVIVKKIEKVTEVVNSEINEDMMIIKVRLIKQNNKILSSKLKILKKKTFQLQNLMTKINKITKETKNQQTIKFAQEWKEEAEDVVVGIDRIIVTIAEMNKDNIDKSNRVSLKSANLRTVRFMIKRESISMRKRKK